jgi:hypothetical protein
MCKTMMMCKTMILIALFIGLVGLPGNFDKKATAATKAATSDCPYCDEVFTRCLSECFREGKVRPVTCYIRCTTVQIGCEEVNCHGPR